MLKQLLAFILAGSLVLNPIPAAAGTAALLPENTVVEKLTAEEPTTEETVTEETATGEPVTEKLTTEEPAEEKPTTEEPAEEEPTTEKPAEEEPTIEEPTEEETTTEEPAEEKPTTEEPAEEEPTTEESAEEEATIKEPITAEEAVTEDIIEDRTAEGSRTEVLTLGEIKSGTLGIPDGVVPTKWYSFTAPEDGYYNLYGNASLTSTVQASVYTDLEGKKIRNSSFSKDKALNLRTNYVRAGETVYFSIYKDWYDIVSYEIQVQKLTISPFAIQQDGTYRAETEEYILNIIPEAGNRVIRVQAVLEAKEGVVLKNSYRLETYYRNTNSEKEIYNDDGFLYAGNAYQTENELEADSGSEYELYFVLMDGSNTLSIVTDRIKLKTKMAENAVEIYDTKVTEDRITFDMEIVDERVECCYYGPVNGEKKRREMSKGWEKISFNALQSDTEYSFRFCDKNGNVMFEIKERTAPSTLQVEYSAAVYVGKYDKRTLKLTADISGYKEDSGYLYFEYEYTNMLGEKTKNSRYYSTEEIGDTENGKSFTIEAEKDLWLTAGEVHDITMWLEAGGVVLEKTVKQVTVPPASCRPEDITFIVEAADGGAEVTVKAANLKEGEEQYAQIYRREHGSKVTTYNLPHDFLVTSSERKGHFRLSKGVVYDFLIVTGGVAKEFKEVKTESTVNLVKKEEKTDAFEAVRTFKIEGADALEPEYYLSLYYYIEGFGNYSTDGKYAVLNAANNYEAEVSVSKLWESLTPDEEYNVKWVLSTKQSQEDDSVVRMVFETFHTRSADITVESVKNYYNQQEFAITLNEDMTNYTKQDLVLYAHIRKVGEEHYIKQKDSVSLTADNNFSDTISLSGLEGETDYEMSVCDWYDKEFIKIDFTTPKDTTEINIIDIGTGMSYARINYMLSGIEPDMSGYVHFYVREKGTNNKWGVYSNDLNSSDRYFHITYVDITNREKLKENTEYEYIIGIGQFLNVEISQLEKAKTGEFKTKEDLCALSDAKVLAGYKTADIQVLFRGNAFTSETAYITFFYREKKDTEWIKISYSSVREEESAELKKTVQSLKIGTDYEYAIVITNQNTCDNPDNVTSGKRKVTGEFTTKQNGYSVDFVLKEDSISYNKAAVILTAKDSTEVEILRVSVTLNDGQEKTVTLKRTEDYKKEITFTDLLGGQEYKITKAVIEAEEKGAFITIAELPCDYAFTTERAKVPAAIKLSREEITLNAAYPDTAIDGVNSLTLIPRTEPETAVQDFVWSSDNETAAVVSADGTVQAKEPGTAVITVTSLYDNTVKASCQVTVKYCLTGLENPADGSITVFENSDDTCSLYKGSALEGLGLYEKDKDGNLTLLPAFTVTPQKSGIVVWEDRKLFAKQAGKVGVILEKDGVKALCNINVTAEGKGFAITGFSGSEETYPAIREEDGSYTLAYIPGIIYKAEGEISPAQTFRPEDMDWSVSDSQVAEVSEEGVVTPKKAGTVLLKAVPKTFANTQGAYLQTGAEVTLHIKELPAKANEEVLYALANTDNKIKNVPFPKSWGTGWSWKYPETPLVTNGVNKSAYDFEAVYSGEENYPCEAEIPVYIGKITGAKVTELLPERNRVVEIGGTDFLTLEVTPVFQGVLSDSVYTVEIPEVKGLTIEKNTTDNAYKITASKAGNYTLRPVIKAGNKIMARTSCKITAVKDMQAASITLTTDTEGVTIEGDTIIFDSLEKAKNVTLQADITDRDGKPMKNPPKLTWKSSDRAVANAVPASKKDTKTAKITPKGAGHAVITVTANDKTKHQVRLNIEIQDHAPRVNTAKSEVNLAYNYNDGYGRKLAYEAGGIEILSVYGKTIADIGLFTKDGKEVESNLKITRRDDYAPEKQYIICPAKEEIPTGTYKCILRVGINTGESYDYPITIKVIDKLPSVSMKMTPVNLFYRNSYGNIDLTVNGSEMDSVVWEDASEGGNGEFLLKEKFVTQNGKRKSYIEVFQCNMNIRDGKLTDTSIARGTLKIKLKGYRKLYTYDNFAIKYNYKKPQITAESAGTDLIPAAGINKSYLYFYNKTEKKYLYYNSQANVKYNFDEISCDSSDVQVSAEKEVVTYSYSGAEKTKKVTFTVNATEWRESIQVGHSIKTVKPKAYLSNSLLTYNTVTKSTASAEVYLKQGKKTTKADFTDMVIQSADKKAEALLAKDLLTITSEGNRITAEQSQNDIINEVIPGGTYRYKITPYYTNALTGEKTALNTLTLKIKIVNQPVKVNITPKGSLDLANGTYVSVSAKINTVFINPVFRNLGSEYSITGYKLTGEYSKYFNFAKIKDRQYRISPAMSGKLKAGQAYKLAVRYTITAKDGKTFRVTSNTFTIKPKQSRPKIKIVSGNNQTLYASSDLSRRVEIAVPNNMFYSIDRVSGSIDCNKDGKPDIVAKGTGENLTVEITDKDGVGASVKGKSYNIPVTVELRGRDGISKDVKITVKVKVKR